MILRGCGRGKGRAENPVGSVMRDFAAIVCLRTDDQFKFEADIGISGFE